MTEGVLCVEASVESYIYHDTGSVSIVVTKNLQQNKRSLSAAQSNDVFQCVARLCLESNPHQDTNHGPGKQRTTASFRFRHSLI